MGRFVKSAAAAAAYFLLPWLFAAWLFWKSSSLPFPWLDSVTLLAAALIGYFLSWDRKNCLERFCRKQEPEKAPQSQVADPELRLRGLFRLLALYVVLALTWSGGYTLSASYLWGHSHIGPIAWAPFARALAGLLGDTPRSTESELAVAAAVLATALGSIAYAAGRAYLFPYNGPVLRGRRVRSGKEARKELSRYQA